MMVTTSTSKSSTAKCETGKSVKRGGSGNSG